MFSIKDLIVFYAIGTNSPRTKSCYWGGLHAEIDALRKIKKTPGRRPLVINIIVIRVNKNREIGLSQPCVNCIKKMKNFEKYKNIKIKNIYFSKNQDSLIKISFKNAHTLPPHISSGFKHSNLLKK